MAGLGPADPVDPHFVRRIDPDPDNDSNSYSVTYSVAANELYLRSFGDDVVYTYAAASTGGDPWADAVVDAHPTLDGAGLYTDPQSVLGMPTTTFYDPLVSEQFHVSLVAAPFNLDSPNGQKVVTTINSGQFIKVRFDEPVQDDPRNPFGIDLIVFGNSFFIGNGFPGPTTDMAAHILTGDVFSESVTVAVSPTGLGTPQSHPDHWYVYTNGPFADALYPSNAYEWDRQLNDWDSQLDFATPVDPSLAVEEFAGGSVADGIDLYECSGGGTGFDLAESGFSSISYVYLTGVGGEVDALSDVFPSLGDFDRDGDVDLRDVASFQNCFHAGFTGLETCACRSGDFDGNRVVDLEDYAAVASFFEGPS
ncbi:MAG: hypothetical protein ACE5HE_00015 [Phycisphaerae bacterium]